MVYLSSITSFLSGLVVSAVVIYTVTTVFGRRKGLMKAIYAALSGSVIYSLADIFIESGLLSTFFGSMVWLLALKHFYRMGWTRAVIIAAFIWILSNIVSVFLPTLSGPF